MKAIRNEDNYIILQLVKMGGSLRATIPAPFVKERKLKDKSILRILKDGIEDGELEYKMHKENR